jgi:exonuclease VII small subunit
MTIVEGDLLAALKELLEASQALDSGKLSLASDLERYHRAVEWSNRVITLAESEK